MKANKRSMYVDDEDLYKNPLYDNRSRSDVGRPFPNTFPNGSGAMNAGFRPEESYGGPENGYSGPGPYQSFPDPAASETNYKWTA